ncbi:dihydrofolate reductase family protein [Sphaerisporangium sp. NPDC005288]|uniref:dihydrofolate reductase family protein n=1 Tax=Sphaerisporangium sp. NPDC005288 TaxID=3155114 RepID=UPI00339DCBBC
MKTAGDWPKTRSAGGDTAEEIAELKAEPRKDLVAAGGTEFMHSLIKLGVVDEYRLWVLPAVTGKSTPLFPELDQAVNLRLVKSTAFPSGILERVYTPA